MSSELAGWLRRQRQARGWPIAEMARQLRRAAADGGDHTMPGGTAMCRNIRRWENGNGGISERGQLVPHLTSAAVIPAAQTPSELAYRWIEAPEPGEATVEREVLMAAHEGSEHAEQAERRDIGEATLEQLRALDRRLWPRDQTELYLLLGCLNCLMGDTADDLGNPHAAEELLHAAWAYAMVIDHRPLMAKLRLDLASIAYWSGRPREACALAASGLDYLPDGPTAAQLHLKYGRASARLGDAGAARRAIAAASDAMEREQRDELLEIGGEFDLSDATQHYLAGSALLEIPDTAGEAVGKLELATGLYQQGNEHGAAHSWSCEALAQIDLTIALLRSDQLDAAFGALAPVLSLPVNRRVNPLPRRLAPVRAELARPPYHGSPQADSLDEQIEDFMRETIATEMESLSGGPG